MIKVSVIIPVYGVEQYLDKCVSSVVNQDYDNLEIFLVDDGGADRCPKTCDEWAKKDSRIKVIHKENGGQGTARNAALDICTGEYILFVDSDDYIKDGMISSLVNAAQNGKYDIVLCGYTADNNLRKIDTLWYKDSFECDNKQLMLEYLQAGKIITGPVCKLFKKTLFEDIRFPNFRANEDAFIMHRLFGKCNYAYFINKHLYVQNIRQGSTEQSPFNKSKMHILDCDLDLREYITEKYPEYTDLVLEKPAKSAFSLLDKIIFENSVKRNWEFINVLEKFLLSEKEFLIDKISNSSMIKTIDNYFINKKTYIFKLSLQGVKKQIKNIIKRILICIKNTSRR